MQRTRRAARSKAARAPTPQPVEVEADQHDEEQAEDDAVESEGEGDNESHDEEDGDEQDVEMVAPGSRRLQFNEPLTWRAGKPIPQGELLRRLQKLSKELEQMDQEEVDVASVTSIAQELATSNLLTHKEKGPRAWTAACIVDVFRCTAPNAPYTKQQLNDIFTMLVTSIIPALGDPANAYNAQHVYVIKSLSEVKSIVLLAEVPSSTKLTQMLFETSFDILSNQQVELSKVVEYNLTGMLISMVDEVESLHINVTETILAQFLRIDPRLSGSSASAKRTKAKRDAQQTTLPVRQLPPSYNMARNICNASSDRMAPYVTRYFNHILEEFGETINSNVKQGKGKGKGSRDSIDAVDGAGQEIQEESLAELEKAFRLLRELWRSCPPILSGVIPSVSEMMLHNAESVRVLTIEAVGDLIAGIGAAGPPEPPQVDPAVYPSPVSFASSQEESLGWDPTIAKAPQSFIKTVPQAYQTFVSRRADKSGLVRAAWVVRIGRILRTEGGGLGLDQNQESELTQSLSSSLADGDERVRLAAIEAMGGFDLKMTVLKLGALGGFSDTACPLGNLGGRVKDTKPAVRSEAIRLLGHIWGIAAGEIASGNEEIRTVVGPIPSTIFAAGFLNDDSTNIAIDEAMHQSMLPLSYPILPSKKAVSGNGASSRVAPSGHAEPKDSDADALRAERMLLLARDLDSKARSFFNTILARHSYYLKLMQLLIQELPKYNGGVGDSEEVKTAASQLQRVFSVLAKTLPNSDNALQCLWKLAKLNDRRTYNLMGFCIDPGYEYKKMLRAMKEIHRKLQEGSSSSSSNLASFMWSFLYRSSNLFFNTSHIPTILKYAHADSHPLASAAHDLLKQISTRIPVVLQTHVKEIRTALEENTPSETRPNDSSALDQLKTCASFARNYPEDLPTDRNFFKSMSAYALHGSPPAVAKHAVTIILSSAQKQDMHARDLLKQCVDGFEYDSHNFAARLACLSQLMLLYAKELEEETDAVVDIAIKQVLLQIHNQDEDATEESNTECQAKAWALKVLVNRVRCYDDPNAVVEIAKPVYDLLNKLVVNEGELFSQASGRKTPSSQKNELRLQAALSLLKLSSKRGFDTYLRPEAFNKLALCAQDENTRIRHTFVQKLRRRLGQNQLTNRFYTIPLLFAFEPVARDREEITNWFHGRSAAITAKGKNVPEEIFARYLSLLAHHPDFGTSKKDLVDQARYIAYYLLALANADNLSMLYHIAQRVKGVADAINPSQSENLYVYSDLAQVVIRSFEEAKGWSMQAFPGKVGLPKSLFAALAGHDEAQTIANTSYIPEDLDDEIDPMIRKMTAKHTRPSKAAKRKSEHSTGGESLPSRKKARPSESRASAKRDAQVGTGSSRQRSKRRASWDEAEMDEGEVEGESPVRPTPTRKSTRSSGGARKNYAEDDSSS